jgi:hypothetical protein
VKRLSTDQGFSSGNHAARFGFHPSTAASSVVKVAACWRVHAFLTILGALLTTS